MDGNEATDVLVRDVVIAGWAGRDRTAIEEHIRELQELGVKAPSSIPCFYRVAAQNLTNEDTIQVLGEASSGEAEVVVLSTDQGTYVTVGSDHTDRDVEAYSVAVSKQLCQKPISQHAWAMAEVANHWDDLELISYAVINGKRELYQKGRLSGLLTAAQLIGTFTSGKTQLAKGTVMYCGTLPVIGRIRPATRFEMELHDPHLGRSLRHAYDIVMLPRVE